MWHTMLQQHNCFNWWQPWISKSRFQRLQQLKYLAIALQGKTSSLPWTLQLRQQTGIVCQVTLGDAGGKQVHHWAENRGDSCGNELKWNRYFVFWYSPTCRKPEKFTPVWNQSRSRKSASNGSLSKEIFPIGEEFRTGTAISLGFVKLLFRLQPLLFFLHQQESSTTWATYHLQQITSNFKLIQGRKVVSPC